MKLISNFGRYNENTIFPPVISDDNMIGYTLTLANTIEASNIV
jgi:hypothetical protein